MANQASNSFETLSPWAEADPIPARGIAPRITELSGKRIGLFRNRKRAAQPLMSAIEAGLKKRFPDTEFSSFANPTANEPIIEQELKQQFEDWLKGVDAVVAAVGD